MSLIKAFLNETHQQQTSAVSEITWRQRTVQVTSQKIQTFFLTLQEFEEEIKVDRYSRQIIFQHDETFICFASRKKTCHSTAK